jgi:hypothetical protein
MVTGTIGALPNRREIAQMAADDDELLSSID